jgi:hypothetical protein
MKKRGGVYVQLHAFLAWAKYRVSGQFHALLTD